uniref:Calmodulin n=1 Tax=Mucochytrium quahogii TaxID=96639 RepID=A0A7S2RWC7_9STRA|mmetsp:Transcript_21115/g.45963  ORF Transcript_21115/g.45963 Transcript_21115/m.45963 type:complete len:157 (+) Transcript_21115:95-565(+)
MSNTGLTQEEIDACRESFLKFDVDRSGTIDQWELKGVLQQMGQHPSDEELFQMISEVDDNSSNSIDFSEFLQVIAKQKELAENSEESDVIDAWVAVGGDRPEDAATDPEGVVDTNKLVKIIKQDFGLPIDIEKLVREIDLDGSGEIDFHEFKQLLC